MRIALLVFLLFACVACNRHAFRTSWTRQQAPDHFRARFETTKGNFEIEATRSWSPLGVDRLYQLIKHGYYTNAPFYRVVPNFVVQWNGVDSVLNNKWIAVKVPDEPVQKSNTVGTMSFARSGKESRSIALFINLRDNLRLDTVVVGGVKGYPGIAQVTKGMELVPTFYEYNAREVMSHLDSVKDAAQMRARYPKMDYIKKAYLLKD